MTNFKMNHLTQFEKSYLYFKFMYVWLKINRVSVVSKYLNT